MPMPKYGPGVASISTNSQKSTDLLPLAKTDSPGLFSADIAPLHWNELWKGMPAYDMGNTKPVRSIIVHFRSDDEVEQFAEMMGVSIDTREKRNNDTIWFTRDPAYVAPKELVYTGTKKLIPRYPIYIPSVGRWQRPYTARALNRIGADFHLVVEPAQYDNYAAAVGEEKLLVLPEDYSTQMTGSIPARNWIWEHSLKIGAERHWVIDDNVKGFLRLNRNRRIAVSDGSTFRAVEDFTDRYENIAFSGFSYMYLTDERDDRFPPFYLNTRVYSMILVNNSLPYRWRGRYNEDTDICLRALKDGWCTVLFNAFLGEKISTLIMKGGNTDTVYATGDKRLEFARSLERQHPDVVQVVWRYDRWHHEVNYSKFARNKLIEKSGWSMPVDPEYGMKLTRSNRQTRYEHLEDE